MDNEFKSAVDYVIQNEIGPENIEFVDDPDDSGRATKFGITQATLSDWYGRSATRGEVKDLDRQTAELVYRVHYWNVLFLYELTPQSIATAMLDAGVLFGVRESALCAQRALGTVTADGVVGPNTTHALNRMDPKDFVHAFQNHLTELVADIIDAHGQDQKFRKGWLDRITRYSALVQQ